MNKQELYDRINQLPSTFICPGHGAKVMVTKDSVLELVRQLEEPKKVVVPQLVAEWIDFAKEKHLSLHQSMDYYPRTDEMDGWLRKRDNQELFARAWLDGYTIEREKLYTVEIPNPNNMGTQVNVLLMNAFHEIVIVQKYGEDWKTERGHQLTESEIRKDFEWAWQAGFAKEVDR